jgi:hypothetical protein
VCSETKTVSVSRRNINLPSATDIRGSGTQDATDVGRLDVVTVDNGDPTYAEMRELQEDDGSCATQTDDRNVNVSKHGLSCNT